MKIITENLGKRFNRDWLFRSFNFDFFSGKSYAVTGPNGSGKSTFLQTIAGVIPHSEGKISYTSVQEQEITPDDFYKFISIATPYQELIEEFTLNEILNFHLKFKKLTKDTSPSDFIDILQLGKSKNKEIKFFSSGMKQRVKLGLALYSDTPVLLLDEPMVNLDSLGKAWYKNEIIKQIKDRLVIICSNQEEEYDFCSDTIDMGDMQKK